MKNMMKTIKDWKQRVEQRRQLAGLNDHLLKDIGITRSDVMSETRKAMWER